MFGMCEWQKIVAFFTLGKWYLSPRAKCFEKKAVLWMQNAWKSLVASPAEGAGGSPRPWRMKRSYILWVTRPPKAWAEKTSIGTPGVSCFVDFVDDSLVVRATFTLGYLHFRFSRPHVAAWSFCGWRPPRPLALWRAKSSKSMIQILWMW